MNKALGFIFATMLGCYSELLAADLIKNQVFNSKEGQRTYDLYLPDRDSDDRSPLVVLLHGHFGDADTMTGENKKPAPYKIWLEIAEREGWVLLVPDGAFGPDNSRGWNDCRADATTNPSTDDVEFLNNLVDRISVQYPIDRNRVYAHGTSNGGNMVFRLALESGSRYRAVAAVVASMPAKSKCVTSKVPVSVLVMNGTDDPILPYEGGAVSKRNSSQQERGSVVSTEDTIAFWLDNNGITSQPAVHLLPNKSKTDRSRVVKTEYVNGKGNTEVVLYKIKKGGHVEPSLSEHYRRVFQLVVGRQNKDIEMSEEVWKFFARNN